MFRSPRYCRRCQAVTDHIRDPRPRLRNMRWLLPWLLALAIDQAINRWRCMACLRRED